MMKDTLSVRFLHPSDEGKSLTVELPRSTLFGSLTALLYEKGFVEPQKGDYRFLIKGHLCGTTHPLGDYVPEGAESVEIQVFSYALIMV